MSYKFVAFFINFFSVPRELLEKEKMITTVVLCDAGVNMFEAYRQKCSAEDLSRLKAALCSGEIFS